MDIPEFQRARRPEQKRERSTAILAVAREMLDEGGHHELTLNGLARRVGLAKSNLYRYFETREAILLQILVEDWQAWSEAWERELPRLRARDRASRVARYIATSANEQPRLCHLVSVLSGMLEHNMSVDQIRDFKRTIMGYIQSMALALHRALPDLEVPACVEIMRYTYAMIASMWPTNHPAPNVRTVLDEPEFAGMYVGFVPEVERGLQLLIRGLQAEASSS